MKIERKKSEVERKRRRKWMMMAEESRAEVGTKRSKWRMKTGGKKSDVERERKGNYESNGINRAELPSII